MGIIAWLSLLRFSWLRRCRTCGVRGSKCLCRHPSLALEHIFFLEERKNKFGIRNFSHVSDTMMTSISTGFARSTANTGTTSSINGSTVVMRGAGSVVDGDVNPTDYYFEPSGSNPMPSVTSDGHDEVLTPRMNQKTRQQRSTGCQHTINTSIVSAVDDVPSTTLVRKQSTRTMTKVRRIGDKEMQPPLREIVTGEYILYPDETNPVSLPLRPQHRAIVPPNRRRPHDPSNKCGRMTNIRQMHKDERGVSFQFHGLCSAPPPPVPTLSSNRSLSVRSSCSTNDSFMMGTHSISSMRVSQFSDRVSLETNLGSLNPQSNLTKVFESSFTPSIQEDEEAQALETLKGWLHASSVSTQDSFMWSR